MAPSLCRDGGAQAAGVIAIERDGGYVEVADNGKRTKLEKAAVTLNDCLACRYLSAPAC